MIVAISCIRNEADIVETNIRHLLAQGVDLILIIDHSQDATSRILDNLARETGKVKAYVDHEGETEFRQDVWMNELARMAHDQGADWILPFDADEFWIAEHGRTISEVLNGSGDEHKYYATLWHHADWDHRVEPAATLHKVCYRWQPDAVLALGAHEVSIPGGVTGQFHIRHLQYRSFAHFCAKIADIAPRVPAYARQRGDSTHITSLEGLSREQMLQQWEQLQARATVYDPIPVAR